MVVVVVQVVVVVVVIVGGGGKMVATFQKSRSHCTIPGTTVVT